MSGSPIEALDLAALLCSRVCHDLISPVGAIVNGLEVLDEAKDEETKTFALDLIKKSANTGSAKLQFCRIAFGAAGSAGAQIDLGDAETIARGFLEDDKTKLAWNLPRVLLAEEPGQAAAQYAADRRADDPARRPADRRSDRRRREPWDSRSAPPAPMPRFRPRCRSAGRRGRRRGARRPSHPAVLCRPAGPGLRASRPTMAMDGETVVVARAQ